MSKRANPALIGAFVIGAVALGVVFVLVFGSGRLFRDVQRHVVYFDESIGGLRVGANVNFRGVRIGQVTGISVNYDVTDLSFLIPVTVEIDPGKLVLVGSAALPGSQEERMESLVGNGLRARLSLQSFVTGLFEIELDFFPESELVYRGEGPPFEVPSTPSTAQLVAERAQQFSAQLQDLPLEDLVADVTRAAAGIEAFVNSPDTQALPGSVRRSLRSIEGTMSEVREEYTGDSDLNLRISAALDEITSAARSLRVLAEYLEQHPESLVRGKANP